MTLDYGNSKRMMPEVCDIFSKKYPDRELSRKSTISGTLHTFTEIGNITDKPNMG